MPLPNDGPPDTGEPVANSNDVVQLYQRFLGRLPENDGAIVGRLGRPLADVIAEIAGSQEAANFAATRTQPAPGNTGPAGPVNQKQPTAPFVSVIPGLDGAMKWLSDVLGAKLADARAAAEAASKHIQEQVDAITANALPAIQKAAQNLQTQLSETAANLIPNTLSLIGAGLGGIGNLISTFLSNAADIGDIVDVAAQGLKDHETGLEDFVHNAFGSAFGFGIEAAMRALLPKTDSANPIRDGYTLALTQWVEHMRGQVRG